ncbi:integral membrane protein [hydrocarbon metagenome]|uniref:Integral membrane protein n=1 Tax=hydrocarbon metagenome TaxID=938273 RepID=A0A0W8F3C2_9ZZZZ
MEFLPKGRLDAFADGVLAIVITLLVLDLSIPAVTESLTHALVSQWSVFLAYIISFAFVGSVWISHSSITALMKQESPRSYRLTLLMLFFVSLIPFTTKLMAFYLSHPPTIPGFGGTDLVSALTAINGITRSALSAPVTVYGLDLLAASVTLNAIMKSAVRTPGMLIDESAKHELVAIQGRQQVGVYVLIATLVCGLFLPIVAVAGYIVVSIVFFITPTISFAQEKWRKPG